MKARVILISKDPSDNPLLAALGQLFTIDQNPSAGEQPDLVAINCRSVSAEELAEPKSAFQQYLVDGKPLLLLDPDASHQKVVAANAGASDGGDPVAVYLRRYNLPGAGVHHCIHTAANIEISQTVSDPRAFVPEYAEDTEAFGDCDCPPDDEPLTEDWAEENCGPFVRTIVDEMLLRTGEPAPLDYPTGLKYFSVKQTLHSSPFKQNKAEASLSFSNHYLGFLDESKSSKLQYLVITTTSNGSPGTLNNNKDTDRGWYTASFQPLIGPGSANPMEYEANIPIPGKDSFDIDVSYKDPVGGYGVYKYSTKVASSWKDFSVVNKTSGTTLSELFYMTSPYNGSNPKGTWTDAVNTWGHVASMPDLAASSFAFDTANAWYTDSIYTGSVAMWLNYEWQFNRIHCTSGGSFMCFEDQWEGTTWHFTKNYPFYIDFSPINPS